MASNNSSSSSNTFTFIRIPAADDDPIEEINADKSGGLENDALLAHAKSFFGATMVDITALTVPTAANHYTACSLYAAATADELPINTRATNLVIACGYDHNNNNSSTKGDVFIGRCRDHEAEDVWERLDFQSTEADAAAPWCKAARESKHHRPRTAASLQSLLQTQMTGQPQPPAVVGSRSPESASAAATTTYGQNQVPVLESWGQWTQEEEEVEVHIPVDIGVTTKDCQVKWKRNHVTVHVGGEERLSGSTFDPIDTDESTFTFQKDDDSKQQRWLVLHLAKSNPGATWTFAIR